VANLEIKSAGDLRAFLVDAMMRVSEGKLSAEKAAIVVKAASQINESFYAEIKTRVLEKQLSGKAYSLGNLPVGGTPE
jgi:hypothetical protein